MVWYDGSVVGVWWECDGSVTHGSIDLPPTDLPTKLTPCTWTPPDPTIHHPPFAIHQDPADANALDSSLWELEALKAHYHPAVATMAKDFERRWGKKEKKVDIDDYTTLTYKALFEEEVLILQRARAHTCIRAHMYSRLHSHMHSRTHALAHARMRARMHAYARARAAPSLLSQ